MENFKLIYTIYFVFCGFLIKDTISIYSPNDGIKTKTFRHDLRFSSDASSNGPESQPIVMHHEYSQVISNRPGSQYASQYNQQKPHNTDGDVISSATTTTAHTTNNRGYQGSNRVYQESTTTHTNDNNDHANNQFGRISSKLHEIENNLTPYQTECPAGATGQFPYALDCRRFLNCWKGRGHIQTCAPGTVFNPDTLECDNPQKVFCPGLGGAKYENGFSRLQELPVPKAVISAPIDVDSSNDNVKCHPRTSGVEPHPFDCMKFLNCANGLTHIQKCGPGNAFNDLTLACDFLENVDCGSRKLYIDVTSNDNDEQIREAKFGRLHEIPRRTIITTSIQDVKCPTDATGVHPHPFDCKKFLNCAHGSTTIQQCGPGTLFNELILACDWPQKVDCGTRRIDLDVSSTINEQYDIRRPYNEHVILSPGTQTIRKVTTTYSNSPSSYGSYSQKQEYTDHQHTENCQHNSHSNNNEQISQTPNQNTRTIYYTQSPITQIVYPKTKWTWTSTGSSPPQQSEGGWSHTRNVTTIINSQTVNDNQKPDVSVVYPTSNTDDNDDDDVQRPSIPSSQFTIVYPEQQNPDENDNQRPIKSDSWIQQETEQLPSTREDDSQQRPISPSWTSNSDGNTTTTTFYSQSHTRQPGYGKQYSTTSYTSQPSGQYPPPSYSSQPSGQYPPPSYISQPSGQYPTTSYTSQPSGPIYTRPSSTWSSTPKTYYTPSYSRPSYFGSGGYPSYQQKYNQSWTTVTTGSTNNQPQTSYGNSYVQQATVREVPKSNYELILEKLGLHKNFSINTPNTSKRVYYAEPADSREDEENFENIAGGDIPAHPIVDNSKNKTKPNRDYDSEEDGGQQQILPLDLTDYQNPVDSVTSESNRRESSTRPNKAFDENDNLYGGLLPPLSSSEASSTPFRDLLPQPYPDSEVQSSILIPSQQMLPPYIDKEENYRNKNNSQIRSNERPRTADSISIPSDHMLPPLNSEEEHQRNLPVVPVPSDQLLPPLPSTGEHRQTHTTTIVSQGKYTQFTNPSQVPSDHLLPPMTSEEEEEEEESQKTLPVVSVPPDYMLPPMTSEEERQQTLNFAPIPSLFSTTERRKTYSSVTSKENYRKPNTVSIPSDTLLPPLTSEEERQKITTSTSTVPVPMDYMLPPMTPEEELKKAFNSSSKVIPLSKDNKSTSERPTYAHLYSSPYSSVTHSRNWSQIVSTSSNNNHPSLNVDEYYPSLPSLNRELENEQIFNDSVIVQSPPIRITSSSSPSYYRSTTRTPNTYSTYNRQYYIGSPTNSYPDGSTNADVKQIPISDALKILLRPYMNRSGTVTNDDVQKSETHIMKIVTNSYETKHEQPKTIQKQSQNEQEPHEKDVEFIFTGEQSHFNQEEGSRKGSHNHQHYEHHPHHSHHHYHFEHDPDFHQNNPHLPSPFESPSSNYELERQHNHRHHDHSLEFHRRHPHLPNPFEEPSLRQTNSRPIRTQTPTPLPDTTTIPIPAIDQRFGASPTNPTLPNRRQTLYPVPKTTTPNNDDTQCQFDCQNGKCIKEFEVCDGVNNCGNRLDEKHCEHLGYEVRLSNEEGKNNMGRVEVKVLGKWGYVCDDKFGIRDADVLCRELGFPLGASEVRGNSYYPANSDMFDENNQIPYVMDEIDCLGNETSLKECDFKGWGVHDCTPEEIVGVVCKVPVMKCPHDYWLCSTSKECIPPAFVCDNTEDCADKSDESENICNSTIQYRLAGGDGKLEGRVEVKYRGKWGTICDDDFTEVEAQVVCKSLGFNGRAYVTKNAFGPGTGPIWLDQVSCLGNETSIDKCIHWEWGDHNCNHTEDVSIRCTVGSITPKLENNGNNNNRNTIAGVKGRSSSLPPSPPRSTISTSNVDERMNSEEIDNFMYQVERSSKMLNENHEIRKCGYYNPNLKDEFEFPEEKMQRVVQGTKAPRGRHPWQATIRTKGRSGKSTHWCGAVLISKRHLLTAAHCLTGYQKEAYFVRLGDHYANIAESSETDIFIENWYTHEEFRKGGFHMNNDIALIVLKQPVQFNDYIQPICLPSKHASYEEGKICTISGWGSIQSGISTPSNYLRAAKVPIINEAVCKRPIVYGNTITDGMFCAGYLDEGTDACDGDSGGPLVCTDNGVETLYGIISWGQHCGYPNKPGVYIKISHYIDWIYNKINFLYQQRKNNS